MFLWLCFYFTRHPNTQNLDTLNTCVHWTLFHFPWVFNVDRFHCTLYSRPHNGAHHRVCNRSWHLPGNPTLVDTLLAFLRTIFMMDDRIPVKQVLLEKVQRCVEGVLPVQNIYDSPISDMLNVCHEYGVMGHIRDFADGRMVSKTKWRETVWGAAWAEELREWGTRAQEVNALSILSNIVDGPAYSIWWEISDADPALIRACEIMVKLLCKSSMLKGDQIRLRRGTIGARMCIQCGLGAIEDAAHLIMQCPAQADIREELHNRISMIHP